MDSAGVGILDIYLVRDPESFDLTFRGGDRDSGLRIGGSQWGELFFDSLKCPLPPSEPGDMSTYAQRREAQFRECLPRNPMLARIWDMFVDAWYRPGETAALRAECVEIHAQKPSAKALKMLETLTAACDEALKEGMGLYLVCD